MQKPRRSAVCWPVRQHNTPNHRMQPEISSSFAESYSNNVSKDPPEGKRQYPVFNIISIKSGFLICGLTLHCRGFGSVTNQMENSSFSQVNGNWRVIRSCAYLGEPGEGHGDENYCLMRTGTFDVFIETCTCNSKDGCNSSTIVKSMPVLLLLLFAKVCVFLTRYLWHRHSETLRGLYSGDEICSTCECWRWNWEWLMRYSIWGALYNVVDGYGSQSPSLRDISIISMVIILRRSVTQQIWFCK